MTKGHIKEEKNITERQKQKTESEMYRHKENKERKKETKEGEKENRKKEKEKERHVTLSCTIKLQCYERVRSSPPQIKRITTEVTVWTDCQDKLFLQRLELLF